MPIKSGAIGMVIYYSRQNNTASVMISDSSHNAPSDVLHDVPCPMVEGVKYTAPRMGQLCWLVFVDGPDSNAFITHFYKEPGSNGILGGSEVYDDNIATFHVPRYILEM